MNAYIPLKYKRQQWQRKTQQVIRLNKGTVGNHCLIQIIGLRVKRKNKRSKGGKNTKQTIIIDRINEQLEVPDPPMLAPFEP